MQVTATEFKANLGHYLDLAATEDVLISKNGNPVARLTGPALVRGERMRERFGILPASVMVDEARAIREERSWGRS